MGNTLDHRRIASNLAVTASLRETGASAFVGRASHAMGGLRGWLSQRFRSRRAGLRSACPDDHTLNDIGLTRVDMRDWGP